MIPILRVKDCFHCPHAYIADVRFDVGTKKMIYCSRLDCDNWQLADAPLRPAELADPTDAP